MAILLQYNEQIKWTFQQLLDNTGWYFNIMHKCSGFQSNLFTGISQENLQQILGILFKVRLLECDVDENNLLPDTEVSLYQLFKR